MDYPTYKTLWTWLRKFPKSPEETDEWWVRQKEADARVEHLQKDLADAKTANQVLRDHNMHLANTIAALREELRAQMAREDGAASRASLIQQRNRALSERDAAHKVAERFRETLEILENRICLNCRLALEEWYITRRLKR